MHVKMKSIKLRICFCVMFAALFAAGVTSAVHTVNASSGKAYGESCSLYMSGKKWTSGYGYWDARKPVDNYLQITVKGKSKISKLRYREEFTNTWYYVSLSDKSWKYSSTSGNSTTTVKLKALDGFLEVQLYDSVSTKRKATLKLTGKITKKPEISTITRPSSTSAKITWKKFTCTIYVDILRAASANGKYTKVASVYFGDGSYTDKGLKAGQKYYYKLRLSQYTYTGKIYSPCCAYKSVAMPASAVTPVFVPRTSWVRTGNYYGKIIRSSGYNILYYKDAGGKIRKISGCCCIAVGVGNTMYYSQFGGGTVLAYNMNTGINKVICEVNGTFLGYYNGSIYYSLGYPFEDKLIKTYRMNLSTGAKTRVTALDWAGTSCQYKNYMVVRHHIMDVVPATLKIYNMSTGKTVKTISDCTAFKVIRGKLYYSVCKKSGSDYVQTIYRCELSGSGVKKMASCSGSSLPPNLGSTYMYFPTKTSGTCIKYEYATKKKKRVSDEYRTRSWWDVMVY